MLDVSAGAVNFGEIAVNDIPSYRRIALRNTQDCTVCVHLSSTSPCVKFQLENENASIDLNDMDDRMCYNELFDTVNLVDAIHLKPGEEKSFVTFFRAEKSAFGHLLPQAQPITLSGVINFTSTAGGSNSSAPIPDTPTGGERANRPNGPGSPWEAGTQKTLPAPVAGQPVSSGTLRSESISLPMYASVYMSQLQVSPVELQATMAPNKTQVLDFTVTNVSSRPLAFVIRSQTMAVKGLDIALYEAERFEEPKLGHRVLLDSHASIGLSVMLRTTASSFSQQQYLSILQCDNLRDPDNTVLVHVNVNIVSESQGDLVSLSDTSVDFGDVYRGSKSMVELGFLNVEGRGDVTMTLSATYKRKAIGEVLLVKDENAADELILPAQKAMQYVRLVYKPAFAAEIPDIEKIKFELDFTAASLTTGRKQRVVVWCSANLFTSTIIVPQKSVNFGDCQVGEVKRRTFTIENQSPLPGSVLVQIRSKIISIEGASSGQNASGSREICEEFTIGPSSKLTVTLKITPQRVNPTYRKQLSIVNMTNPNEDKQIINIEANNMAPPEAKMHNELYTWDCRLPGGLSQSEPLCTIANVPALVPYTIKSKSSEVLALTIKSTCPEIDVVYCPDPVKTQELERIAAQWRYYCVYGKDSNVGDLVATSPEHIEQLRHNLVTLLAEHGLAVTELPLEPKSTVTVFAVIIRSTVTTDAHTKEDGLLISVDGVETPRFVRLSYRLCGSFFELLGQKTKNFGEVNIGIKKVTKVPIENKCKSVLFVRIEKSRSVTAGHIRIEHTDRLVSYVVIRPFATKEIELSFLPGIKGNFDEKIKVNNVLDPLNSSIITLKATVIKADTFDVSPDSWNFGSVMLPPLDEPHQQTRIGARFMVTNTSKTKRQIRVRLDVSGFMSSQHGAGSSSGDPVTLLRELGSRLFGFSGVDVRIQLEMELSSAGTGSARKIEEEIEKLEQKLKIHERKKKLEKMEIVRKRIEELKKSLQGEEVDLTALANSAADHDYSESEDESTPQKDQYSQSTELMLRLLRDGAPLPAMAAGESVSITFGFTCSRMPNQPVPPVQTTTLNLLLYEAKDQEVNRIFPIDITLVRPEEEDGDTHSLSTVHPSGSGAAVPSAASVRTSIIFLETADSAISFSSFMGHPLIVLRNTIVNDHTEVTFLIKATNPTTVVVLEPRRCGGPVSETLDARFKFFPRNGIVSVSDPLRIVAECTPRSVGPQKYFVPVKNLQNAADVQYLVVELNPTEEEERVIVDPKQLIFRDLITPCDPKGLEAQLLLIRSRFQFPHSLLVRSNKPSQVLLFEDAQCTIPLRNPIQRTFMRESVRVYTKYSPSPKSNHSNARHARAGIVVEAIVANGEGRYTTIGQSVVDVTARVGSGLLEAPSHKLQFGPVGPHETQVVAAVPLHNPSDTFSIRTKVVAESSNITIRSSEVTTLRPHETKQFLVEVNLRSRGLYHEHVSFRNLTCRQEPITVELSLFQRDDSITALTRPSAGGDYVLPAAAVARSADGSFHLYTNVSTSLAVKSSCVKDIILASQCPLPLSLSADDDQRRADVGVFSRGGSPASPTSGGGRVRLEAHRTQKLIWTLLAVPELGNAEVEQLLQYDLVHVHGVAHVQVAQIEDDPRIDYNFFRVKPQFPSIGQCVLVVPFVVPLAVSEGRAEPAIVNMGVVGQSEDEDEKRSTSGAGHWDSRGVRRRGEALQDEVMGLPGATTAGNGGTDRKGKSSDGEKKRQSSLIRVKLTNLSRFLPLQLKVECQPIIRFTTTRICIPPGETTEVEAKLQLKEMPAQGPFRYEAFFVNALNPENDMAVAITGQYYWKVFRLATKTVDDLHETLTLPSLHVEGSSAIPTVLSEEKLTISATEPNVELGLQVQSNPKLEGLVQLQVLHYDATSSAQTLSFHVERSSALGESDEDERDGVGSPEESGNPGADGGSDGPATGGDGTRSGAGGATGAVGGGVAGNTTAAATAGSGVTGASAAPSGPGSSGNPSNPPPGSGTSAAAVSAGGGGSAGGPTGRRQDPSPPQRPQTVRVRCVLLRSDLGSLASCFTGFRKKGTGGESFTFDQISELERRRSTSVFSNMWLGTITFSNRLTKDEDITVFGQLDPFTTFTAPSKLSLAPSRVTVSSPTSPTPHHHLVYVGQFRVTNACDRYVAELAASALISEQLTMPITVEVTSVAEVLTPQEEEEETEEAEEEGRSETPVTNGGAAVEVSGGESFQDTSSKNLSEGASSGGTGAQVAATTGKGAAGSAIAEGSESADNAVITTVFTNAAFKTSATGGSNSSLQGKPGSSPTPEQLSPPPPAHGGVTKPTTGEGGGSTHRFRVGAKAAMVLRVLVYSNQPRDMMSMQQSSLEQLVALAVVDENVFSSTAVVRLNVTPLEGDVEEAPMYTGEGTAAFSHRFPSATVTTAEERSADTQEAPVGGGDTYRPPLELPLEVLPPHPSGAETTAANAVSAPKDATTTSDSLEVSAVLPSNPAGAGGVKASTPGTHPRASPQPPGEEGDSPGESGAIVAPQATSTVTPAATATTGTATTGEDTSVRPLMPATSTRHILSLKGCSAVPDCPGAYSVSFSVPRGEAPQGDISIRNNLHDRPVRYTASVTSQSPLSWILLPSNSGTLEPGETQPLRLNLITSEVGSFVGYVAIDNSENPYEVVYLRLSAEVFVPSSGEGLFEVVTISGYRVASNEVRNVSVGHLYGSRASRAYIATELINRSNVPLEFPVSVVKPFRIDTKPVRDSAALAGLYHRHHHHHHHHRQAPQQQELPETHQRRHRHRDANSPHPVTTRPEGTSLQAAALPSSALSPQASAGMVDGDESAVAASSPSTTPASLSPNRAFTGSRPVFEGKLVACHIHGVPTQASQKYIVVDPKSRVRLAFVLSCLELNVADGYGVFGEADVIVKCKQARDANFTFRVRFEAYPPTFQAEQEVEIGPDEDYAKVAVRNALPVAQIFVFRSQSPVLHVVPGTGSAAGDEAAFVAAASTSKTSNPSSFASLEVKGGATGYFAVRVDVMRAAALLNFDRDDGVTKAALCEHAFILNALNPRERVRLQFRQGLKRKGNGGVGTSAGVTAAASEPVRDTNATAPLTSTLIVPSNSPAPILGSGMISTSVAKPVKVGGQHIGEHFIMHFAQDFTSTLSFYAERLLKTFEHYSARKEAGVAADSGTSSSEDESDNDDSSTLDSDARSRSTESKHTRLTNLSATAVDLDASKSYTLEHLNSSSSNRLQEGESGVVDAMNNGPSVPFLSPGQLTAAEDGSGGCGGLEGGGLLLGASAPTTAASSPHRDSCAATSTTPGAPGEGPKHLIAPEASVAKLREERKYGLPMAGWRSLRALLVELTWLVDELVFYSILLRNSRLIQGYCVFLTAAVCNHPVVKAWRQHKADLPAEFSVFADYLETLDCLPCSMPS